MTDVCRTVAEVLAAAAADPAGDVPLTQDQADLTAALLAPHQQQDDPAA
jgi:hypothetical protein